MDYDYSELQQILKRNLGTICRDNSIEDERVRFSKSEHPDQHPTVITAAIWVRQDRPGHSSKYKTFILRSLESSRGRSAISDGSYAETYCEAMEWIAEKSEEYSGRRINWLELPKVIIGEEDLSE